LSILFYVLLLRLLPVLLIITSGHEFIASSFGFCVETKVIPVMVGRMIIAGNLNAAAEFGLRQIAKTSLIASQGQP